MLPRELLAEIYHLCTPQRRRRLLCASKEFASAVKPTVKSCSLLLSSVVNLPPFPLPANWPNLEEIQVQCLPHVAGAYIPMDFVVVTGSKYITFVFERATHSYNLTRILGVHRLFFQIQNAVDLEVAVSTMEMCENLRSADLQCSTSMVLPPLDHPTLCHLGLANMSLCPGSRLPNMRRFSVSSYSALRQLGAPFPELVELSVKCKRASYDLQFPSSLESLVLEAHTTSFIRLPTLTRLSYLDLRHVHADADMLDDLPSLQSLHLYKSNFTNLSPLMMLADFVAHPNLLTASIDCCCLNEVELDEWRQVAEMSDARGFCQLSRVVLMMSF